MTEEGLLAPEWRRWLVENLLRGTDEDGLVAVLEGSGVDAARAREAVRAESEDPTFLGAAKALAYQRKLEGLFDLYGDLYRQAEGHERVDRHDSLSPEDFFARYYFLNKPVVVRGVVVEDAAVWTPESLRARLPEARRGTACLPVPEDAALRPPTAYVRVGAQASPPQVWVEEAGAKHPPRPARANVLLCQVHGRRRLQLVPAFELRRMSRDTEEGDAALRLDVELGPGDMLLIPVGWWHGHALVEPGVALSFEAFAAPGANTPWRPADAVEVEPTPPPLSPAG